MLTADTITDEQIRELCASEVIGMRRTSVLQAAYNARQTEGGIVGLAGFHAVRETRQAARARCAEILNARAAVKP